jgi:MFS transporter, MHS family, shikimate and dehydroshikimate transport protein
VEHTASSAQGAGAPRGPNWVLTFANTAGTTIEAYDFFLYGIAAGLVFNKTFFIVSDPALATVIALGAFAAGYVMRPIGGLLFGHFGDKLGRKNSLILTLLIGGSSTFLIGLLPTYASIGAAAPVLLILLRLLQGIALGGEHGGAILMAVEYAPPGKRGRYVSGVHMGYPGGVLLAVGAMVLAAELSGDKFLEWGWRVPFLLGGVIVLVGFLIRRKVAESPVFVAAQKAQEVVKWPIAHVLKNQPRQLLICMLVYWCATVTFLYASWVPSYLAQNLHAPRNTTLHIIALVSLCNVAVNFCAGWFSDVIGRRRAYLIGALIQAALAFPEFALMNTATTGNMFLGTLMVSLGDAIMGPIVMTYIAETFRTTVRYTGVSIAYQFGAILGSGLSAVFASWVMLTYHSTWYVSVYLLGLSALGFFTMLIFGRETSDLDLRADSGDDAQLGQSAPAQGRATGA